MVRRFLKTQSKLSANMTARDAANMTAGDAANMTTGHSSFQVSAFLCTTACLEANFAKTLLLNKAFFFANN